METLSSSSDESTISSYTNNKHVCTYKGCNASFSKKSKLSYHVRRHTGERPFVCDEPNCGKTYLYSFHLRRHKDTHHGTKIIKRIMCPHEGCELELANKYSLKKHIKLKHNPKRQYPFSCEDCKLGFHRKRQLLQHIYVHTGILPYKCEKCETRFFTPRDLNRHNRTHTNYSCTCKETFERWSAFLKHRKTCESKRFKCNVCKKTFIHLSKLKIHQVRHENEKTYNCSYDNCFRSYLYKRNLKYHINKCHKKIELHRLGCTEPNCQMSFTRMQNLQNHIDKCHSNEETTKAKKPRRPRKDKGLQKGSTSARLAGLLLPINVHHDVIQGIPVSPSLLSRNVDKDHINTNDTAENISLNESSINSNNIENIVSTEDNANKAKTTDNENTSLDKSSINSDNIANIVSAADNVSIAKTTDIENLSLDESSLNSNNIENIVSTEDNVNKTKTTDNENKSVDESSINSNNIENTVATDDSVNKVKTTDIMQETSQNIVNTYKLMLKDVSASLNNKEIANINLNTAKA